ncbi:MAG: 50S ribosomal protein L29 [Proteobacteria bacterium]|jgi:large subunit ribosomal protein L29|nr:50S ribosomal protein L29 [Pseudomonadota bacterium]MBQ8037604.1 50S ribosomal protein L29 [Pseudomonadota bacterium]MBQ9244511.1 50S ribosomal protein L29 [Pseudomonadota bacterium]
MKAAELSEKSQAELKEMLDSSRKEYFRLKMRQATGQLDKVSDMVKLRKDIARLNTVIRERELRG